MAALLLMLSYWAALFVVFFFFGMFFDNIRLNGTIQEILAVTFAAVVGLATRSYRISRWYRPGPMIGSFLILLAHVGTVFAFALLDKMSKSGAGSGLVFLPALIWCGGLYPAGILAVAISLNIESKKDRPTWKNTNDA